MTTTNFKEKEKKTLFRENEFFLFEMASLFKIWKKIEARLNQTLVTLNSNFVSI